jgi:hypothetical protein
VATVNATTIVRKGYESVVLLAGDEIPEWAADQVGDHLIKADDEKPADDADDSDKADDEKPAPKRARA